MENLKVAELKMILKSRGLSCKGNKTALVQRLQDQHNSCDQRLGDDAVRPDDSVSQARSHVSCTSASRCSDSVLRRAEEAADIAALSERMRSLRDKQCIKNQIAELKQGQELLELQATINELAARERAFKAYQNGDVNPVPASSHSLHPPTPKAAQNSQNNFQQISHTPSHRTRTGAAADLIAERERTAALMRLPPIEIKKFDGDITHFTQFIRSFEMKIASKLDEEGEKLHYLEQNLVPGSKPHTIVASCMYLEDGYQQAMEILHKRYGHPSTIAAAFMDKISNERQIGSENCEDLDKFALLLLSCKNALGDACSFMSDPRTLRNITVKLPISLLNRWRRRVDDLEECQGRSVVFEDLVEFVVKEARIATNAAFGQHMYHIREGRGIKAADIEFSSGPLVATTHAQGQALKAYACLYCGDRTHAITECSKLNGTPSEEKNSFVMSNSLCFGCLRRGHRRSTCRMPAVCKICSRSHPTVLHDRAARDPQTASQQPPQENNEASKARVTSCRTSADGSQTGSALPLVAVRVSSRSGQSSTTYAFLDSAPKTFLLFPKQ